MTHALIVENGQAVTVLDDYLSLRWTRAYWGAGRFTLRLGQRQYLTSGLAKGRFLLPDAAREDEVYLIEQIEAEQDEQGRASGVVTVTGRGLDGFLAERLCLPPSGQAYDVQSGVSAETAMRHYVNANLGPGAAVARRLPGLTLAADQARGGSVREEARHQTVEAILQRLGLRSGLGWEIVLDGAGNPLFRVLQGVDRRASVFLDVAFDTVVRQQWLTSDLDRKTWALVAGQGDGAARQTVARYTGGSEPSGYARRELFVDARDLGNTTALEQRGDTKLAELQPADRFDAAINQFGSFRYREHWDLGDLVTIRNTAWGISQAVRIVTVTSLVEGTALPQVSVELDRPWPTLKDRLVQEVGGGAANTGTDALTPASINAVNKAGDNLTGPLTIQSNTAWHAGNDGAGSGLDADLLDGIDSARVIFGGNLRGVTNVTDFNAITKSGFYDGFNATGAPAASQWHHVIHNQHSAQDGYALQLAVRLEAASNSPTLFVRIKTAGTWGSWRAI